LLFARHGISIPQAIFPMFTSMFLHGGWLHLLGNMLFLWVFGGAVEEALGHFQYLIFYLICGVGSALVHTVFNLGSKVPTIGASGAISGVMGAFIVLFPRARVTTLIPALLLFFTVKIPAYLMLGYWFFLQFLMLATGVLCKEFITWKKDGRRAHIFNPSAIALFVFSVGLIVTHSTHISWGEEIAVSFDRPPHIYMEIFLLGLVVQALFSVTLVTLSAAASLYALNVAYTGHTGLYYFVDTNIPAAVFLGLHLLVTDPATSPKKNFGKIVFGAGYGVLVFGLYWFLGLFGAPTFYDKLLCVPPLNLTVRALDRASAKLEEWFRMPVWNPKLANYAYMAVWIGLFAVMWSTGFLRGQHPGADEAFWRKACSEGRESACGTWVRLMNIRCYHGSGTSCLVLGVASNENQLIPRDQVQAGKSLAHACELGLSNGCARLLKLVDETQGSFFQSACDTGDGESCFLLGSLYYAGRGVPKDGSHAFALFERSCSSGWPRGCSGLGECYRAGVGTAEDNARALELFDQACRGDVASSCFSASGMYREFDNEAVARKRLRQGCQISAGFVESSAAYAQAGTAAKAASLPAVCSAADR